MRIAAVAAEMGAATRAAPCGSAQSSVPCVLLFHPHQHRTHSRQMSRRSKPQQSASTHYREDPCLRTSTSLASGLVSWRWRGCGAAACSLNTCCRSMRPTRAHTATHRTKMVHCVHTVCIATAYVRRHMVCERHLVHQMHYMRQGRGAAQHVSCKVHVLLLLCTVGPHIELL